MFKRDQPLFSRPVLAAIIVISTLAVWLLNLTAPTVDLTTPKVNQWRTESGIPVVWVTQDTWQAGNHLSLSFVFNGDSHDPALTATTLTMLGGPSLPLSTATLNQRLTPLGASADTLFTPQHQYLNLTLSNQTQFLIPSFKLFDAWLNQTQFKATALHHVLRQQRPDATQQQLLEQLMPHHTIAHQDQAPIELAQIQRYLDHLKQHVSHIVIAGAMDQAAQAALQSGLNQMTASMSATGEQPPIAFAEQPALTTLRDGELNAMYGGIALKPLSSVEDWLALQIWARDLLDQQKQRFNSNVVQWQLQLSGPSPFATWQIQVPSQVLQEPRHSTPPQRAWLAPNELPSYRESDAFKALKQPLLERLKRLSQTPQWWRQMGSQVTTPEGAFSLRQFAEDYSTAANSFTIEQYQQRIDDLLRPTSLQEVQVTP